MNVLEFCKEQGGDMVARYGTVSEWLSDGENIYSELNREHRHYRSYNRVQIVGGKYVRFLDYETDKEECDFPWDDDHVEWAKPSYSVIQKFAQCELPFDVTSFKPRPEVTVDEFLIEIAERKGYKTIEDLVLDSVDEVHRQIEDDSDHHTYWSVFIVEDGVLIQYGVGIPKDASDGEFYGVSYGQKKVEVVETWV